VANDIISRAISSTPQIPFEGTDAWEKKRETHELSSCLWSLHYKQIACDKSHAREENSWNTGTSYKSIRESGRAREPSTVLFSFLGEKPAVVVGQ